jgi:hypothetical protein
MMAILVDARNALRSRTFQPGFSVEAFLFIAQSVD